MQVSTDAETYRAPQDLVLEPSSPQRIIIVGSCLAEAWTHVLARREKPCDVSLYFTGHPLPEAPEYPLADYDFQLVQLALRFVLPDGVYARLAQTDVAGHEALLAYSVSRVRTFIEYAMRWNRESGLLTFVMPLVVPQQNLMGRLLPRYDLRNPVFFVEKLNETIAAECASYQNCFLFDFNEVLAAFGRRHIQEDQVMMFNHGSFLFDIDFAHDQDRLEPVRQATEIFDAKVELILNAAWRDLMAMYRTVRQKDQVKLVVLDLDDTLWRGVAAEVVDGTYPTSEGWPKALWEACLFLKRRGLMLAIVSKNDETRIRAIWRDIFKGILQLDDFAVMRINWEPKARNMAEVLAAVNVLPGSVLFIDDNPVERAAVKEAFPDMRVLGGNPVTWRRILLSSAETQVAHVTDESAARTAMIKAQVRREADRSSGDHHAFLAASNVRVRPILVATTEHPRFARALELINKTNQFNTTGKRWSSEGCVAAFARGARLVAFEVEDRYTDYGLVAVGIVAQETIEQFVMSCRVMGLGVETAAIAHIIGEIRRSGVPLARATMTQTDRNLPCRDIYARCGFDRAGDAWHCPAARVPNVPSHVTMLADKALTMS